MAVAVTVRGDVTAVAVEVTVAAGSACHTCSTSGTRSATDGGVAVSVTVEVTTVAVAVEVAAVTGAVAEAVVVVKRLFLLDVEVLVGVLTRSVLDLGLRVRQVEVIALNPGALERNEGFGGAEQAGVDRHPGRLTGLVVEVDLAHGADLVAVAVVGLAGTGCQNIVNGKHVQSPIDEGVHAPDRPGTKRSSPAVRLAHHATTFGGPCHQAPSLGVRKRMQPQLERGVEDHPPIHPRERTRPGLGVAQLIPKGGQAIRRSPSGPHRDSKCDLCHIMRRGRTARACHGWTIGV